MGAFEKIQLTNVWEILLCMCISISILIFIFIFFRPPAKATGPVAQLMWRSHPPRRPDVLNQPHPLRPRRNQPPNLCPSINGWITRSGNCMCCSCWTACQCSTSWTWNFSVMSLRSITYTAHVWNCLLTWCCGSSNLRWFSQRPTASLTWMLGIVRFKRIVRILWLALRPESNWTLAETMAPCHQMTGVCFMVMCGISMLLLLNTSSASFHWGDNLLLNAAVADINKRASSKFKSLQYFVIRFPRILSPLGNKENEHQLMDKLQMQFLHYQVAPLPDGVAGKRIDEAWHELSKDPSYDLLSQVMLGILVLPHSNADSERVFSVVRKNHTDFRPTTSRKLLESTLVLKTDCQAKNVSCFQQRFSQELLKKAKSATYVALGKQWFCRDNLALWVCFNCSLYFSSKFLVEKWYRCRGTIKINVD